MAKKPIQLKLGKITYNFDKEAMKKSNELFIEIIADYINKKNIDNKDGN